MKKIFFLLSLVASHVLAQEKTIISSPLGESHIYEFIKQANPNIDMPPEIAELAAEVLEEWAKAIAEIDGSMENTFVKTNNDYVIICNLWLESSVGERTVQEMLFADIKPLIIKNMKEDSILECFQNSNEAGVSFMRVQDDDIRENVEIFLILLSYPTND